MARRRSQPQPSLFPFISVLICVIGTLSLLIAAAGLTSSVDDATNLVRTGDPILGDLGQARRELETVQNQHDYYADRLEDLRESQARSSRDAGQQQAVVTMLADALAEEDSLRRHLADLQQQVRRHDVRPSPQTRLLTVDSRWQGQHDLQPLFLECRSNEVEILASGTVVADAAIAESAALDRVFDRVARSDSWCVFLLVRPGGVEVFDKLHARCLGQVPLGYQPVMGEAALDVSDWPRPDWLEGGR